MIRRVVKGKQGLAAGKRKLEDRNRNLNLYDLPSYHPSGNCPCRTRGTALRRAQECYRLLEANKVPSKAHYPG